MHPPIRDQADIGTINHGLNAADEKDGGPVGNHDVARQEFAKETDTNYLMSRYGVEPLRGTPQYGEWDFTTDLQSAFIAVEEAQTAYRKLPPALREKFRSMEDLITAIENGTLVLKDGEPPAETPVTPPTPTT